MGSLGQGGYADPSTRTSQKTPSRHSGEYEIKMVEEVLVGSQKGIRLLLGGLLYRLRRDRFRDSLLRELHFRTLILFRRTRYRRTSQNTHSRNCLENPNGLHSGVPRVGKMGREGPLSRLWTTKNTRSRPVQLFSKQFLEEVFSEVCIAPVQRLWAYLAEISLLRVLSRLPLTSS
jgi:hypothetical protein